MDAYRYGRQIAATDDIIGRRLNRNPKHTYQSVNGIVQQYKQVTL